MSEHEDLQPLVQLEQHNIALLFANYLSTLGIETKVISTQANNEIDNEASKSAKQEHVVYCQQDKMAQAKLEFESFIKKTV